MDNDTIVVSNELGEEVTYKILFTFENEDKSYVLYYDETEDEPTVFASIYDEEGHLFDVDTAEEWEMINEVFESFMSQDEENEEDEEEHECACGCGGHHHHHDENHECCCGHDHDEEHECECGCDHDHDDDHECECGCGHHHE